MECVECGADGEFVELLQTPDGLMCRHCDYPVILSRAMKAEAEVERLRCALISIRDNADSRVVREYAQDALDGTL